MGWDEQSGDVMCARLATVMPFLMILSNRNQILFLLGLLRLSTAGRGPRCRGRERPLPLGHAAGSDAPVAAGAPVGILQV